MRVRRQPKLVCTNYFRSNALTLMRLLFGMKKASVSRAVVQGIKHFFGVLLLDILKAAPNKARKETKGNPTCETVDGPINLLR
jgi:hypothetical protein